METKLPPSPELAGNTLKQLQSALRYCILFGLLWIILTHANPGSWIIGVFIVPAASWTAVRLLQLKSTSTKGVYHRIRIRALFQFIPFFTVQSFKGGVECALYALNPHLNLESGFIRFKTQLPDDKTRLFLINTISLLPGTVCVDCQNDLLTIHALNMHADNRLSLQQCEQKIALLFALEYRENDFKPDYLKMTEKL